jgi:hypothetical protein
MQERDSLGVLRQRPPCARWRRGEGFEPWIRLPVERAKTRVALPKAFRRPCARALARIALTPPDASAGIAGQPAGAICRLAARRHARAEDASLINQIELATVN